MNTAFKKVFCLFVCLTLIVSLFAGCGKSTDESSNKKSKSQPKSTSAEPVKDPTAGIDFGGGKIKYASWVDDTPKLGNTERGDAEYYALEAAKKKYNVSEVEFYVSAGDTVQKEEFTQAALAGSHYCDIFTAHSWFYMDYIRQNLLYPVTDYVTTYDPEHFDLILSKLWGQVWGLSAQYNVVIPNNYFVYNTDILQNLNLENPQILDTQGKWTWDVFEDYCKKAVTLDGVSGVASFNINEVAMNSSNLSTTIYDDTDGKYYNVFSYKGTKDQAAAVLDFINRLVNVDKVMLGTFCAGREAGNLMATAFRESKLLFCNSSDGHWKDEGMTNFAPVQYPTPKENADRYQNINAFTFPSIPTGANYSAHDLAYFYMDSKTVWDKSKPNNQYYELNYEETAEELLASTFNSIDDVNYLIECGKKLKGNALGAGVLANGSSVIWDVYNPVMENTKTAAQVMEETAQAYQKSIDDTLNNFTYKPEA